MINSRMAMWFGGFTMGMGLTLFLLFPHVETSSIHMPFGMFVVGGVVSIWGVKRMDRLMTVGGKQ